MMYQSLICTWNVIDDSHKVLLGSCLLIFGVIGLALNLWLFLTLLRSSFLLTRSYLFLLALCIINLIKSIFVVPFDSISALSSRWVFGYGMCQLVAFLRLMVGIFQMITFTLIAIERLISIIYYKEEKKIEFSFYLTTIIITWVMSTTIASLPLAKIGNYIYDTSCTSCELDWKMKPGSQTGFNISVIVLGGFIPILLIVLFLTMALSKECYIMSRKRFEERLLTKCVAVMIALVFLLYFPRALLIFWIPLVKARIPKALSIMAPLGTEVATIIPVLTYLVYLPTLRDALI
ncbi:7 transmembrane receptor (rhodopsin family) [Popillia japonica]